MAVFSHLPNELIIHIWSYMIEPESVESFALVSKRVYGLAAPFLEEHAGLKQEYSTVYCPNTHPRAADLLETMLLNPRIALYIKELRIYAWGSEIVGHYNSPLTSCSSGAVNLFKEAIRSSSIVAPSEAEDWAAEIERGNADLALALIMMQLNMLDKLMLHKLELDVGQHSRLFKNLHHIAQSSEAAIHPGPSYLGNEISSNNQAGFVRPSLFSNLSDLHLIDCDWEWDQVASLLRTTRELKSFSFCGCEICTVEPFQICDMLLASSQNSLQELGLKFGVDISELEASYMGTLTRFESLTALEVDFVPLLGPVDTICLRLADVLPMSIERVTLYSTQCIPSKTFKALILQMVTSKTRTSKTSG